MPNTENEEHFIQAWQKADAELKRLKQSRLRALPESYGAIQIGATRQNTQEAFHSHGLARLQAWMVRLRVVETLNRLETHD